MPTCRPVHPFSVLHLDVSIGRLFLAAPLLLLNQSRVWTTRTGTSRLRRCRWLRRRATRLRSGLRLRRRRWRRMLLVVVVPSARRGRDRDHQPQRVVLLRAICRRHHHRNRSRRAITRWRLRRIALRRRRRRRITLRRRRGCCIHRRWRRHRNRRCRHWRHRWRGSPRYCRHIVSALRAEMLVFFHVRATLAAKCRHTLSPLNTVLYFLRPVRRPPPAQLSDGACRPLLSFARCATNSANFAVSTRSLRGCHAHNAALHLRHGLLDRPHRKCWER